MLDGKEYCKTNGHLARHLKANNLSEADYVERFLDPNSLCPYCSTTRRALDQVTWKWKGLCGIKCQAAFLSATKLATYADPVKKAAIVAKLNVTVTPEMRNEMGRKSKITQTVESLQLAKDKRRLTCEVKYGDPTYSNRDKIKESKLLVTKDEQTIINELRNKTNFERYGTYHVRGNVTSKFERDAIDILGNKGFHGHTYLNEKQYFISGTGGQYFLYDFVDIAQKKIIEFNGDYWHANPKSYLAQDMIGRGVTRKSASDIWKKDAIKSKIAQDKGFQILVIWESEFNANPIKTIEKCIEWLTS